jgi:hypothetical protein
LQVFLIEFGLLWAQNALQWGAKRPWSELAKKSSKKV